MEQIQISIFAIEDGYKSKLSVLPVPVLLKKLGPLKSSDTIQYATSTS